MLYRSLADLVLVAHFAFVAFVVLGGLVVLRRPRLAWLHVPAFLWGALIEFAGFVCPLTPLENALRAKAGQQGYSGGFVEHYLLPTIYPAGLTTRAQITLGTFVLIVNIVAYSVLLRRVLRGS